MGMHPIPVDYKIVEQLEEYKFELEHTKRCIEQNRHNHLTTTYYLLLKRFLRQGGKSIADLT